MLGVGQKVTAATVAAVALASASSALACKLNTLAQAPLVAVGDEAAVEASINGAPIRMLVDTGSAQTILLSKAATQLHLPTYPLDAAYYGIGGFDQARGVRIATFKIGNTLRRDVDMVVVAGTTAKAPFEGLLGETSLGRADLELDYTGNVLRLIRPEGCVGDQVVYWGGAYGVADLLPSAANDIMVNVTLDGRPVRAMIDSGAGVSMVSRNTAMWAGMDATGAQGTAIGQVGGIGSDRVAAYQVRFRTLEIGGEVIRNPKLAVGDMFGADLASDTGSHIQSEIADLPDLLIGADFVRAHHIYVARSQGKVYFSYLGGPIFRDRVAASAAAGK